MKITDPKAFVLNTYLGLSFANVRIIGCFMINFCEQNRMKV